jgi:hypothetical protein
MVESKISAEEVNGNDNKPFEITFKVPITKYSSKTSDIVEKLG